jgi:hypothetical protein
MVAAPIVSPVAPAPIVLIKLRLLDFIIIFLLSMRNFNYKTVFLVSLFLFAQLS